MSVIEVRIPDIGDFQDVEIIEILVKPGDSVEAETSMITLESDKATMDVPAPQAGVVAQLLVKVGDRVSEGSSILKMEATSAPEGKSSVEEPPRTASVVQEPPQAATHSGKADLEAQVVVLGSGPGGYTAAFRAADLGLDTILIEKGKIGGVCLNVGCIPLKALLHAAKVIEEAQSMSNHGIKFGTPEIDIDSLRSWKDRIVGKLVSGLTGMSKHLSYASRLSAEELSAIYTSVVATLPTLLPPMEAATPEDSLASRPNTAEWLASRGLKMATVAASASTPELQKLLVSVVNDESWSFDTRVRAAITLGKSITQDSQINPNDVMSSFRKLAIASLDNDRVEAKEKLEMDSLSSSAASMNLNPYSRAK